MSQKKYVSLDRLSTFLENLKDTFATKIELEEKADISHDHDSSYDVKGSADTALENAQTYTDDAVSQKSQVQIITFETND